MFIVMTILLPLLMAAAFILPGLLMAKGLGHKRIVVIDDTGRLRDAFTKPDHGLFEITYVTSQDVKPYIARLAANKNEPVDGILLMMPSFVYGVEIMRGIIQEKTDRVVEVLLSSVTPRQLLSGKILGLAAVGLTQIGAWLVMIVAVAFFGAVSAAAAGFDIKQYLHVSTFVYFVVFFVLAYLTNVCVYAVGGAVCNSDREAQQMLAPVIMVMMLPVFLMGPLITNPDTPMFVVLS